VSPGSQSKPGIRTRSARRGRGSAGTNLTAWRSYAGSFRQSVGAAGCFRASRTGPQRILPAQVRPEFAATRFQWSGGCFRERYDAELLMCQLTELGVMKHSVHSRPAPPHRYRR
jgi:hypothetical protein